MVSTTRYIGHVGLGVMCPHPKHGQPHLGLRSPLNDTVLQITMRVGATHWLRYFHIYIPPHVLHESRCLLKPLACWRPPGALMASLHSLAHAWPTMSRIALADGQCLFSRHGPDTLVHFTAEYIVVAVARHSVLPRLKVRFGDFLVVRASWTVCLMLAPPLSMFRTLMACLSRLSRLYTAAFVSSADTWAC